MHWFSAGTNYTIFLNKFTSSLHVNTIVYMLLVRVEFFYMTQCKMIVLAPDFSSVDTFIQDNNSVTIVICNWMEN